jgi:hypothetical protein
MFVGQPVEQTGYKTTLCDGFLHPNAFFRDIRKGCDRNSQEWKKKGGIKAHTLIDLNYNMSCPVRYGETMKHGHVLLSGVYLEKGSFTIFDKGYVDYAQYERFTGESLYYITRLDMNLDCQKIKDEILWFILSAGQQWLFS